MAAQRVAGARFRQRKLSTKQNLAVLRESDLDKLPDDDAARNFTKVETGVDKAEETEHHLQAVISAAQSGGKVGQLFIPTPDAVKSQINYDKLYPPTFNLPVTYIRFSSTVEDCTGCPYCMTSEDDAFLKELNSKRGKSSQCAEDDLEETLHFFEETAQSKQPFAAVDNPPVVTYEEMQGSFDETIGESARRFAREIYEHWKNQRLFQGNRSLMPPLKFETNIETDETDPYVCFRRREVRQVRKTRGRDAQVAEKLKKMRKELEEARHLMALVKQREFGRRDQLAVERQVFEQRNALKEARRNLGIKGDDDDLVDQKPPKQKPRPEPVGPKGPPGVPRPTLPPGGRPVESDLIMWQDVMSKKDEEVQRFIDENLQKHQSWNRGWVDLTWRPITPPLDNGPSSNFRTAVTEFLPTPPSSEEGNKANTSNSTDVAIKDDKDLRVPVRYVSPPCDAPKLGRPSFRRRIARGGRLMIDRRGVKRDQTEAFNINERTIDRFKYDRDSDEEDELYPVDPYDNLHIKYRILLDRQSSKESAAAAQARRISSETCQPNQNGQANHNRSASGHLLPPAPNGAQS